MNDNQTNICESNSIEFTVNKPWVSGFVNVILKKGCKSLSGKYVTVNIDSTGHLPYLKVNVYPNRINGSRKIIEKGPNKILSFSFMPEDDFKWVDKRTEITSKISNIDGVVSFNIPNLEKNTIEDPFIEDEFVEDEIFNSFDEVNKSEPTNEDVVVGDEIDFIIDFGLIGNTEDNQCKASLTMSGLCKREDQKNNVSLRTSKKGIEVFVGTKEDIEKLHLNKKHITRIVCGDERTTISINGGYDGNGFIMNQLLYWPKKESHAVYSAGIAGIFNKKTKCGFISWRDFPLLEADSIQNIFNNRKKETNEYQSINLNQSDDDFFDDVAHKKEKNKVHDHDILAEPEEDKRKVKITKEINKEMYKYSDEAIQYEPNLEPEGEIISIEPTYKNTKELTNKLFNGQWSEENADFCNKLIELGMYKMNDKTGECFIHKDF